MESDDYSYEYHKAEQAFNIKHIKSMSSGNVLISDIQKKTKLTLNEMVNIYINGDA
jgi:type II secretory pathway component HofQ